MNSIHQSVQQAYGRIATTGGACCGPTSACCGGSPTSDTLALALGYSAEQLSSLPEGSNLGLSCGHPSALAALEPGEFVVDLGSGAGFDAFIAASRVGPEGQVHGVDMTPEMIAKARGNAEVFRQRTGLDNVQFHHAQIEALPLEEASVDVVISNCVLNLSPDQPQVWREIARILKPGGRVSISDIVLLQPLPDSLKERVEALVGCIAGASLLSDVEHMVLAAGLEGLEIQVQNGAISAMLVPGDPLHAQILNDLPPGATPADYLASALIQAKKPS